MLTLFVLAPGAGYAMITLSGGVVITGLTYQSQRNGMKGVAMNEEKVQNVERVLGFAGH